MRQLFALIMIYFIHGTLSAQTLNEKELKIVKNIKAEAMLMHSFICNELLSPACTHGYLAKDGKHADENYFNREAVENKEVRYKYYVEGCNGAGLNDCLEVGLLDEEKGNLEKAVKQYNDVCKRMEFYSKINAQTYTIEVACNAMGFVQIEKGNRSEARKYFKKSCDRKNMIACKVLKEINFN